MVDGDHWAGFAQEVGLDPFNAESLNDEKLHRAVLRRVRQALKHFPGYAKIRRVHLSLEPWTIENGLITPTLKVKRPMVLIHHAEEVEALYGEGAAT